MAVKRRPQSRERRDVAQQAEQRQRGVTPIQAPIGTMIAQVFNTYGIGFDLVAFRDGAEIYRWAMDREGSPTNGGQVLEDKGLLAKLETGKTDLLFQAIANGPSELVPAVKSGDVLGESATPVHKSRSWGEVALFGLGVTAAAVGVVAGITTIAKSRLPPWKSKRSPAPRSTPPGAPRRSLRAPSCPPSAPRLRAIWCAAAGITSCS